MPYIRIVNPGQRMPKIYEISYGAEIELFEDDPLEPGSEVSSTIYVQHPDYPRLGLPIISPNLYQELKKESCKGFQLQAPNNPTRITAIIETDGTVKLVYRINQEVDSKGTKVFRTFTGTITKADLLLIFEILSSEDKSYAYRVFSGMFDEGSSPTSVRDTRFRNDPRFKRDADFDPDEIEKRFAEFQ